MLDDFTHVPLPDSVAFSHGNQILAGWISTIAVDTQMMLATGACGKTQVVCWPQAPCSAVIHQKNVVLHMIVTIVGLMMIARCAIVLYWPDG